jgi:hypothetical protein
VSEVEVVKYAMRPLVDTLPAAKARVLKEWPGI